MKHSLLVFTVLPALLFNAGTTYGAENAPDFSAITPEFRKQTDLRALDVPDDPPRERRKTAYGSVGIWRLARTPLPADEEFKRAQTEHAKIIHDMRAVPTTETAARIFGKLIGELPRRMKPEPFRFTLTVIDSTESKAWSGGGFVYITRPYLEALLSEKKAGRHRLAFVLAHELGHICRGHNRRRYQLDLVEEEFQRRKLKEAERRRIRKLLRATVQSTAEKVILLHDREEEYQADLFALHLCRNAGFDKEIALDVLRGWAGSRMVRLRN